jgi:hypothetical protein
MMDPTWQFIVARARMNIIAARTRYVRVYWRTGAFVGCGIDSKRDARAMVAGLHRAGHLACVLINEEWTLELSCDIPYRRKRKTLH